MKAILDDWKLIALACITLGLAPFYPEPHIWGKLKWVLGGAHGMQLIDWWDFIMHGAPWFLLIVYLIRKFLIRK
ncbi:MAG TPA: hypothetical protein PKN57_10835 [Saprospiraceae bacterium]|nr:hypothetical protein [Saprospiraceae bacterium]HMV23095.1 hypothetical protein [Saprospiraceae bacterium]HMX82267.1 hypothetical protein [Saprospiraceae bacterium]HMX85018.1 hypothetical protein [Saprospiraceae bacterium]HMZ73950.1 hypothetical protein [Saprospiraceae bacterium]